MPIKNNDVFISVIIYMFLCWLQTKMLCYAKLLSTMCQSNFNQQTWKMTSASYALLVYVKM